MKLVILESPYAESNGCSIEDNIKYARMCLRDSLMRGEAPIASHLLYTQVHVLKDDIPSERALGIAAGLSWTDVSQGTVVYEDLGITEGMAHGIGVAIANRRTVEYRKIL